MGVVGKMLLHVLVFIVTILGTAEAGVAALEGICFERLKTSHQNPLPDVKLSLAVQEQRMLNVLLNYLAKPKLANLI